MRCRVVICAACRTRVDGVNHCHACLKVLGQRPDRVLPDATPRVFLAVLFLGLGWLFLLAILWLAQGHLAP
jgi:hypothetical protein